MAKLTRGDELRQDIRRCKQLYRKAKDQRAKQALEKLCYKLIVEMHKTY